MTTNTRMKSVMMSSSVRQKPTKAPEYARIGPRCAEDLERVHALCLRADFVPTAPTPRWPSASAFHEPDFAGSRPARLQNAEPRIRASCRLQGSLSGFDGIVQFFLHFDVAFVSANIVKIEDGGWVPLLIGVAMFTVMTAWYRGRQRARPPPTSTSLPSAWSRWLAPRSIAAANPRPRARRAPRAPGARARRSPPRSAP